MSDYFQIVSTHPENRSKPQERNRYVLKQQQFESCSYGYYTESFITKICDEAIGRFSFLLSLPLRKMLRQLVKKFMLNDLQLVFVGYFAKLHEWNIEHNIIKQHKNRWCNRSNEQALLSPNLLLFLNLIANFVKTYIGDPQQTKFVNEHLYSNDNQWKNIYQQWISTSPPQYFHISPRNINLLYSNYTRHAQKIYIKKNYNQMVDKILQLSTTYSMIPPVQNERKNKKLKETNKQEEKINGRKKIKVDSFVDVKQGSLIQNSSQNDKKSNLLQSFGEKDLYPHHQDTVQPLSKKIILRTKNRGNINPVNLNVTRFFQDNQSSVLEQFKPQSTIGIRNSFNFFDKSMRSSRYQVIPPLKSNFDSSHLF